MLFTSHNTIAYMRAQGPNAQCMDYHDLSTKLYSPWGHHIPVYSPVGQTPLRVPFHVLFIGHDATINTGCTYKVISYGAGAGI